MAINPNEIDIKNIIELVQSSSIKDNDLLVLGQGIYARKSTVLELYNKFGVPSILTSLNSLQFQINQLNNTVGNSVLYSPQTKTAQQKADARNNLDVYSKTETQTVVNSAIINLGNVVNSVNGVNVDNSDPKNPIVAEFRPIADYNNDMLLKADIDGNLTIGGIWWQDQVLSDRFANYKQVWTALSNNTIEWGNIQLDKHIFLVDDINGVKIKVGSTEGTIWNTLNLTNVSQLNNDAGYLKASNLVGYATETWSNGRFSLLGHTHPISDISGLQVELDLKANVDGSNIPLDTKWISLLSGGVGDYRFVDLDVGGVFEYVLVLDSNGIFKSSKANFVNSLKTLATSTVTGVIKLGSDIIQSEPITTPTSEVNRTYPVQLNSSEQAVVNIPFKDYDNEISNMKNQINDLINLINDMQTQLNEKINKTDTITICGQTEEYQNNPQFNVC